jgi:hypothetical protein
MTVKAMRKPYILILAVAVLGYAFTATAQEDFKKTPYYISLNDADGNRVHEISNETLSLQYSDAYGKWNDIPLKIYNWKREPITTLNLDKAFGLNSFVIDLKSVHSDWELNTIYTCELIDESGRKYSLPIRLVPPPETKDPEVSIFVNPLNIECNGLSEDVVEFYGEIKGGKAPYTVSWFILNSARADFLYQPLEEIIKMSGKTSVVTVDQNPDYYVVLFVKDACGGSQQKVVNLVCEERRKKINTIFVEELASPPLDVRKNR